MEISGLDGFMQRLDKLQQNAKELGEDNFVLTVLKDTDSGKYGFKIESKNSKAELFKTEYEYDTQEKAKEEGTNKVVKLMGEKLIAK